MIRRWFEMTRGIMWSTTRQLLIFLQMNKTEKMLKDILFLMKIALLTNNPKTLHQNTTKTPVQTVPCLSSTNGLSTPASSRKRNKNSYELSNNLTNTKKTPLKEVLRESEKTITCLTSSSSTRTQSYEQARSLKLREFESLCEKGSGLSRKSTQRDIMRSLGLQRE